MQRERDADLDRARPVIAAVREAAPMVHCITATVSMGLVADGLLAAGARPMMTETLQEAPVVTALADALLINFGTLSPDPPFWGGWVELSRDNRRQAPSRHQVILIEDGRETAGVSVRRLHLEDAPSTWSNGLSTNTHCPRSEGASSLFPHPKPTPTTVDQGSTGQRRADPLALGLVSGMTAGDCSAIATPWAPT